MCALASMLQKSAFFISAFSFDTSDHGGDGRYFRMDARAGAHPGFSQGTDNFFYIKWSVGCEKSALRKLFIMLQASSVLPHSKQLKKQSSKMQITKFNGRNPENTSIVFFQVPRGSGPPLPLRGCAPVHGPWSQRGPTGSHGPHRSELHTCIVHTSHRERPFADRQCPLWTDRGRYLQTLDSLSCHTEGPLQSRIGPV